MVRSILTLLLTLTAATAWSQSIYTWTDDEGVHYTDDETSIPRERKPVARKTEGAELGVLPSPGYGGERAGKEIARNTADDTDAPSPDETRWRAAFAEARRKLDEIQLGLSNDRKSLENTVETIGVGKLRRPNPQYDSLKKRIDDEEAAANQAKADLAELDRKASLEGVPREWRK